MTADQFINVWSWFKFLKLKGNSLKHCIYKKIICRRCRDFSFYRLLFSELLGFGWIYILLH